MKYRYSLFFCILFFSALSFSKPKVLMVVTGAKSIALKTFVFGQNMQHPTGYYLGELYEPLVAIERAGYEVDIATPNGVSPTSDSDSEQIEFWLTNLNGLSQAIDFSKSDNRILHPLRLEQLTSDSVLKNYVGLVVPGGHGPMVDLSANVSMAKILSYFHKNNKPTGLICHGPAALLSLPKENWPYKGYRMTVYDDQEELISEAMQLHGKLPFFPQDALQNRGAIIEHSLVPFTSWVKKDRELVTGQNPYSPVEFGEAFVELLQGR